MQRLNDKEAPSSKGRKVIVSIALALSHLVFLGLGIVAGVLIVNGGSLSEERSEAAAVAPGLGSNEGNGPVVSTNEPTVQTATPSIRRVDPPMMEATPAPVATTTAVPTPATPLCKEPPPETEYGTVLECLAGGNVYEIVTPETPWFYQAAKHCSYFEPGNAFHPAVVVKVASVPQASAAIRCASKFGMTVSPRSGAHGFGGDACRGNMVLDLSLLNSFQVSQTNVTWGAGMTHGPLYARLLDHNLVLPGGTETMVGTGGLWLGCGRGVMTQAYGYSCDHLLAVEYVDSNGDVRYADAGQNHDMFWMARGAGGFFPGVVTKFVARADPMPSEVVELSCFFRLDFLEISLTAWIKRLDEWNNPQSKMFSAFTFDRTLAKLEMNCWGCNSQQVSRFLELKDAVLAEAQSQSADAAVNHCDPLQRWTFAEKLASSRKWDDVVETIDLFQQDAWPNFKTPNHTTPVMGSYHGSILVPDDHTISESLVEAVTNYFRTIPRSFSTLDDFERTKYYDSVYLYPMKGKGSNEVTSDSTPFVGRNSKLVIHYKMEEVGDSSAGPAAMKNHVDSFEKRLVNAHGLPCKGFLNYATTRFACASTGEEWLAAFFSNPTRVAAIIQSQDKDGRFSRPIRNT